MQNQTFIYKGYLVEILNNNYNYVVSKDNKVITECKFEFPFPTEAEIHAKLYIDRLIGTKDGWIIS